MTVLSLRARPRRRTLLRVLPRDAKWIAIPPIVLSLLGLPLILSASWVASLNDGRSPFFFLSRQAVGVVVGFIAMFACSRLSIAWIKRIGRVALGVSVLGLLAVLTPLGTATNGSRRWIDVGGITFQPSELAKLACIIVGAELLARRGDRLRTVQDALKPTGLLFGLVAVLVMLEPDLGTTSILAILFMTLLWIAAAPLRTVATFAVSGAGLFGVLAMSADYRRARVLSFLDPFKDPENTGYQAVQSIVALGSGGLFGTGFGMSRQKWLYVPNAHTDFIYAVIGEEAGLIGTTLILAAFGVIAWIGCRIARSAQDPFCRMVAVGITVWLVGQAIINIGAVTSLLPITGVPLPFVSYGNSALMVSLAAVGILVAIARTSPRSEHDPA
jgi:cell division protein FtsW